MRIPANVAVPLANNAPPADTRVQQKQKSSSSSASAESSTSVALATRAPSEMQQLTATEDQTGLGATLRSRGRAAFQGAVGGFGLSTFIGAATGKTLGYRVGGWSAGAILAGARLVGAEDNEMVKKGAQHVALGCGIACIVGGFCAGAAFGPVAAATGGFLGLIGKFEPIEV